MNTARFFPLKQRRRRTMTLRSELGDVKLVVDYGQDPRIGCWCCPLREAWNLGPHQVEWHELKLGVDANEDTQPMGLASLRDAIRPHVPRWSFSRLPRNDHRLPFGIPPGCDPLLRLARKRHRVQKTGKRKTSTHF